MAQKLEVLGAVTSWGVALVFVAEVRIHGDVYLFVCVSDACRGEDLVNMARLREVDVVAVGYNVDAKETFEVVRLSDDELFFEDIAEIVDQLLVG